MKITNITPKLFGKYRSDAPLDLPDVPMVVVYGKNEAGKTTYADMAATLMSSTYDTALINKYGDYKETLKGSLDIKEGTDSVTIQFVSASVPKNKGVKVQREATTKNVLWQRMQSIQGSIIRHIFRVSSHEITNGDESKAQFDAYGLGDRRGTSIRATLNKYETQKSETSKKLGKVKEAKSIKQKDLRNAEKSTGNYEKLLTQIAGLTNQIDSILLKEADERDRLEQVAFCQGARGTISEGLDAELKLSQIEGDGLLINTQFSRIRERILEIGDELEQLKIDVKQEELDRLQSELDNAVGNVDSALASLQLSRDEVLNNPSITNEAARVDLLDDLVEKASKRVLLEEDDKQQELFGRKEEIKEIADRLALASANWKKFNLGVSPQEYSASPRTSTSTSPKNTGLRMPLWSYLLPLVGLGVSFAAQQLIGVAVSIAFGFLLFFLQRNLRPSTVGQELVESEQYDFTIVLAAASEVMDAEKALGAAELALLTLERSEAGRITKVSDLLSAIQEILQQHLIQISASSTARVFTAYFESLKSAANHCDEERQAKGLVLNQESDLQSAQERSVLLIQEIEEIFLTVGIPFDKAFFSSANGSVSVLRTLSKDFEMQSVLREKVATKSRLAKERGDELEIQTMMMSTADELILTKNTSEARTRELQDRRRELENDCRLRDEERETLEDFSQMTNIRSDIESLDEQIRDLQLLEIQFSLQVQLLRKFATKRAEESKPELVKKVQNMVLRVADDWANLEFLTDDEGKIQNIEVRYKNGSSVSDSNLSSGAQSLVYLAMRIAVMHQEASNGLSIPLLCDDPLIYMDDDRTRLALQMLKEASIGHQIVYFTCKKEILNLAKDMEIPVKIIS